MKLLGQKFRKFIGKILSRNVLVIELWKTYFYIDIFFFDIFYKIQNKIFPKKKKKKKCKKQKRNLILSKSISIFIKVFYSLVFL